MAEVIVIVMVMAMAMVMAMMMAMMVSFLFACDQNKLNARRIVNMVKKMMMLKFNGPVKKTRVLDGRSKLKS